MKMTNEEYAAYLKKTQPRSPLGKDSLRAFLVGGAICALGEGLGRLWGMAGLGEQDAGTAASMTLVFLGALLTGLGAFDDIARFSGAGTLVPITGFANSIAAPAVEFRTEGFITGTMVKMFTIAGPVLVCGTSASVVYGIVLVLMDLYG